MPSDLHIFDPGLRPRPVPEGPAADTAALTYRREAGRLLTLAERSKFEETQQTLLAMARLYEKFARHAERRRRST